MDERPEEAWKTASISTNNYYNNSDNKTDKNNKLFNWGLSVLGQELRELSNNTTAREIMK